MQSWILNAEKIQLSLCAMGFGDEGGKPMCKAPVQGMEINAFTKHLLPANTSETCASEYPTGAKPRPEWRFTATVLARVAKFGGAE